jgi:transcriptional regulator with XRE-family HTH domain
MVSCRIDWWFKGAQRVLTPAQSRAGRALLFWSQEDLAKRSHLSLSTVRDFETGKRVPTHNNLAAIERALLDAGAVLLPSENGLGEGARLREP